MQRTPGMYTEINTQTQRTGLPNQSHSIVFVTGDSLGPASPTPIYDSTMADVLSGVESNAGRMMSAALTVSQGVRVETMGKSEPSEGGAGLNNQPTFINFMTSDSVSGSELFVTGNTGGIVYSLNDGPLNFLASSIYDSNENISDFYFRDMLNNPEMTSAFSTNGIGPITIQGMSLALQAEPGYTLWFESLNPADILEQEVKLTFYPHSALPSASFDVDLFDYIIDPAEYTADDIEYFGALGVVPATRNQDGTYTVISQLSVSNVGA